MAEYSEELKQKIKDYWSAIYKQVGLQDAEYWVAMRLKEEDTEAQRVAELEYILNFSFGSGQKHLVVGTGTGGLAVELHKKGCAVYGVEPNKEANQIVQIKAKAIGMPSSNFTTHKAESLPFDENTFDFIHCFSVIEHVDDVKKSINEMIRVLKPNGYIYINTHNYRFPYERHYKIVFPTFLPRVFGYLYLLIKRRPLRFLKHIKYVDEQSISRLLYENRQRLVWQRIYKQYSYLDWKGFHPRYSLWRLFTLRLNIPMCQEIIIRKRLK